MTTTKKSVLSAAQAKWGNGCRLTENKAASTPQEKEAAKERRVQLREQLVAIKEERAKLGPMWSIHRELIKAARTYMNTLTDFALNEFEALRLALEKAEQDQRLNLEQTHLENELKGIAGITLSYRFSIGVSSGMFHHVRVQADSLEELEQKIQSGAAV